MRLSHRLTARSLASVHILTEFDLAGILASRTASAEADGHAVTALVALHAILRTDLRAGEKLRGTTKAVKRSAFTAVDASLVGGELAREAAHRVKTNAAVFCALAKARVELLRHSWM